MTKTIFHIPVVSAGMLYLQCEQTLFYCGYVVTHTQRSGHCRQKTPKLLLPTFCISLTDSGTQNRA